MFPVRVRVPQRRISTFRRVYLPLPLFLLLFTAACPDSDKYSRPEPSPCSLPRETDDSTLSSSHHIILQTAFPMVEYVYARHDFFPEHEDEIDFRAGERIEIVEKDEIYSDGWWQVSSFALFAYCAVCGINTRYPRVSPFHPSLSSWFSRGMRRAVIYVSFVIRCLPCPSRLNKCNHARGA
jgi:SH3 domain